MAEAERFHLARRFLSGLRPVPIDPVDEAELTDLLSPAEQDLYDRLDDFDRRHAVDGAVADRDMGGDDVEMVAAALHDVGKLDAGLGVPSRVVATLLGRLVGIPQARQLADRGGYLGRIGVYLDHPRLGAAMLEAAGADELVVRWAREHHRRPDRCSLPAAVAVRLRRADRA